MKTFIYIFTYFCIILSVSAQNADIETTMRYGFFTSSSTILPLDNGETIIIGDQYESGGWGVNTLRLDKLDASGDLIWTKTYPEYVYFHYLTNVVLGSDNSIYMTLIRGGCDYFVDSIIMKIDSDGNVEWFHESGGFFWDSDIEANSAGGFWVSSANELIEYDGNLDSIQTISISYANISNFDYDVSTGDFIISIGGILIYLGADGNMQETNVSPNPKVYFQGDYILARYSTKIEQYDKQLNLINSIELPTYYPIYDFNDEYIYLANNEYDYSVIDHVYISSEVLRLNQNLEIIDSIRWQYGSIHDMEVIGNDLYMLGDEYTHTYFKAINKDFTHTNTNTDIGMVNVLVATADSTCASPNFCTACNYDVTGIQAVVKNFGTETINYFELNTLYDDCLNICYDPQPQMMVYDNVYIAPGEIDTVDFPTLNLRWQPADSRLCMYTTRPNKLLDKDHDNDEICRDFFYNDITSVHSAEGHFEFSISPNPATDIINLQNTHVDWQKATIKIITIEGKQIVVQTPQIDISTFPAGVYVIHCEYEGASGSERFVNYK